MKSKKANSYEGLEFGHLYRDMIKENNLFIYSINGKSIYSNRKYTLQYYHHYNSDMLSQSILQKNRDQSFGYFTENTKCRNVEDELVRD